MHRLSRFVLLAAAALALGGCAILRDSYDTPEVELPETFQEADKLASESEDAEAAGETPQEPDRLPRDLSKWWTGFENPELNRLVETALTSNFDVQSAIARLAQAEAGFRQTRANEFPELQGIAESRVEAPEDGVGTVGDGESVSTEQTHRLGLRASYEVDLWGANRAASIAAFERSQASAFARRTVAWTLTADVVNAYLEYLSLQDRIATARKTLSVFQELLDAVVARMEGGEADGLQVAQQRTAVAEAAAAIPELKRQRDEARHRLAVLLGTTPSQLNLEGTSLSEIAYPTVAPGVPARLLLRRPDLKAAEHRLLAADADIDTARAAFLPQFNLTAEGGIGSDLLQALIRPESLFFDAFGSVVQDIFDAGANEANLRAARARHRELIATYRQTSLTALREVEDALSAVHFTQRRLEAQRDAVNASGESLDLNRQAYDLGVIDYISLLDAQRTLFDNDDQVFQIALQRAQASVALFKALGGDTEAQATAGGTVPDTARPAEAPETGTSGDATEAAP